MISKRKIILEKILNNLLHSSNSSRYNLLSIRDSKYKTLLYIQLGEYGRVCRIHIEDNLGDRIQAWSDYQLGDQNSIMREVLVTDESDDIGIYKIIMSLQ